MREENEKQVEELMYQREQLTQEKADLTKYTIKDELIVLNVGGKTFAAPKSVLTKYPGTALEAIFNGRYPHHKDDKGHYYIDGDAKSFRYIIHFLRRGELRWPESEAEQQILMDELKHFKIERYINSSPPPPPSATASTADQSEYEFRVLKALGTGLAKLNEIDGELKISSTLGQTALMGIKKAVEIDNALQIHQKLGATLSAGAQLAIQLDNKYALGQKLTNAVVTGCTKAIEIDKQLHLHETLGTIVTNSTAAAKMIDDRYKVGEKLVDGVKTGFNMACELDRQFKVQERVGDVMMTGLTWVFGPGNQSGEDSSGNAVQKGNNYVTINSPNININSNNTYGTK